MKSAYTQKKQKEQETDALLDLIDDYVLTELGIEMPEAEEKKYFVVYASETTERRIDLRLHQPKHQAIANVLKFGKYRVVPFSISADVR
jgi:hypothetical protein